MLSKQKVPAELSFTQPNVLSEKGKSSAPSLALAEARTHGLRVLAILSALLGFASISTDLYLPAMPAMAAALHVKSGVIEWTVSSYLIGFSFGQLFWGPISDRYGRRIPIAIGMAIFIVGSAGCALSHTAFALIAFRILQALGASAGVVLARAIVRDLYSGPQAARMLSTLMTVMAISPLIGPLIGGQILVFASWRVIFWALAAFGVATLGAALTLPETLSDAARNRGPLSRVLADYRDFLGNRSVMPYAGLGGFFFGGVFAYVAATPFAYVNYYHLSPQFYGVLFGAGSLGIMAANLANARLVGRFGSDYLLKAGAVIAAASGAATVALSWNGWGGLIGLALPLFVYVSMCGFIVANAVTGALTSFPHRAGAVSALIGALQYGGGMAGSALVGALADGTPRPLAWVVGLSGITSLVMALVLKTGPKTTAR